MAPVKNVLVFVLLLCGQLITGQLAFGASPAPQIEFLLDLSGSMESFMRGGSRAALAKRALVSIASQLPAGTSVGVRVFGHRADQESKERSCSDSELILEVAPHSLDEISRAVTQLRPSGLTPLGYSLRQIRTDFSPRAPGRKVIILLSDGADSCGGDPIAEISALNREGFKIEVHAIGIEPNAETSSELEGLASVSGGTAIAIDSPEALSAALQSALAAAFSPGTGISAAPRELSFGTNQLTLPRSFERFEIQCREGEKFSLVLSGALDDVRVKLRAPGGETLAALSAVEPKSDVVQPLTNGRCAVDVTGPKGGTISLTAAKMVGF